MRIRCGCSGEVLGMAVSGDPGNPDDPSGGVQTTTYIKTVETVDDFVKYLNLSASASIQADFGRGGARAAWAETLSVHDYSVYVVVYITVNTGTKIPPEPRLHPNAGQLLVQDKDAFRKQYGDEYLAGVTQGGEFIGFLEIRTKDQTDQQQISAGLTAGAPSTGSPAMHQPRCSSRFRSSPLSRTSHSAHSRAVVATPVSTKSR